MQRLVILKVGTKFVIKPLEKSTNETCFITDKDILANELGDAYSYPTDQVETVLSFVRQAFTPSPQTKTP